MNAQVYSDILDVNIYETAQIVRKSATDAIYSFASPELASRLVNAVESLSRIEGLNAKDARRRIAGKLIEDNIYKF